MITTAITSNPKIAAADQQLQFTNEQSRAFARLCSFNTVTIHRLAQTFFLKVCGGAICASRKLLRDEAAPIWHRP
jgi:hypothetical protein